MRAIPFGEPPKSNKKTLYKLVDPYLQFWYRFVFPHLSLLEVDRIDAVYHMIQGQFPQHVAGLWEELARKSCAFSTLPGQPGSRGSAGGVAAVIDKTWRST